MVLAACAVAADPADPLAALAVGDIPEPATPADWVTVHVRAAALNQHDVWTLRGVGLPADRLPMVLGCDAAGVTDDGREVVVYPVVGDADFDGGDETYDPRRTLLSERYPGTLATTVRVPARNLLAKPPGVSFSDAACLPTAYLTAYRMLFSQAGLRPGDTVLVQGAGGGVSTAAVLLGRLGGLRVWVTARMPERGDRAVALGADRAFAVGARLPERVDAVIDSVGAATWSHSLNVLRPGGTLVLCGATSGDTPAVGELRKIFFRALRVQGSTMGSKAEFGALLRLCESSELRPVIDRTIPLLDVRSGLAALAAGEVFGKVVVEP